MNRGRAEHAGRRSSRGASADRANRGAAHDGIGLLSIGRIQLRAFRLSLALTLSLVGIFAIAIVLRPTHHDLRSEAEAEAIDRADSKHGLELALGAAGLAFAGSWAIARRISRRLGAITSVARAIARGEPAEPLEDETDDEVGELARAFDLMITSVDGFVKAHEREASEERTRLDGLVKQRTAELGERTATMRRILDHAPVGLLTVDADGRLGSECSLAATCIFGMPEPDTRIWDYFREHDASFAGALETAWAQLAEDVLPLELALDQLPRSLHMGALEFKLSVLLTSEASRQREFLVVLENVTDKNLRRAHADANHELAVGLRRFAADRAGFESFLAEARDIAARVAATSSTLSEVKNALHTLKGNALMLGFETIGEHCHVLESFIQESGEAPPAELRVGLAERLDRLASVFGSLGDLQGARVDIDRRDHQRLVDAIANGRPRAEVLARARGLVLEPIERRFARLAEQAASTAERVGRPTPLVTMACRGIRMDRSKYARLWSALAHVVRNAVAHGIEPAGERSAAGKSERGSIRLTAFDRPDKMVLEIADDGRGIDWDAVKQRASERRLPAETQADLEAALFAEGISTATEIDDVSGRGVGLSAVLYELRALGGTIAVETARGVGTTFRLLLPRDSSISSSQVPKLELRHE
jgi:two-component system chemotaxis sensor kinase CheA